MELLVENLETKNKDSLNLLFNKIKTDFESDISESQAFAKKTWQQAYAQILAKQRAAKLENSITW